MTRRGRWATVALAVLVVYLIAYAVKVAEDNRDLQKANRAAIAKLESSQQNAADVLAKILAQAQRAEQAGLVEKGATDRILKMVEGLDPEIIQRAIDEARRQVAVPGPPGPTGATGPRGAPGRDGSAPAPTSTGPATTTSTTRSPTTTTSATTSTTTTTRPACTLGLDVPGLARICV